MAHDQEPMTDEDIAAAKTELQALRNNVREALAAELGGEAADYRADVAVTDGGNE